MISPYEGYDHPGEESEGLALGWSSPIAYREESTETGQVEPLVPADPFLVVSEVEQATASMQFDLPCPDWREGSILILILTGEFHTQEVRRHLDFDDGESAAGFWAGLIASFCHSFGSVGQCFGILGILRIVYFVNEYHQSIWVGIGA